VSATLFQLGCKEHVLINSKVSPSANTINVYSTSLSCITHTYYSDSAITSTTIGGLPIYQAVGSIIDPYFGTMTAATYFQIIPALPTTDTFTGYTIDSAVLVLPFSGFTYGDTLASTGVNVSQTYQVFYLLDSLSTATTYYSNTTKQIDLAHPLSAPTTVNIYHLRDSVGVNILVSHYPGLRIKLNLPVLKSHLFQGIENITATSTNPNQDFINGFNGICVRVGDTRQMANAVPYFRLDGAIPFAQAGIVVYYHPAGTTADSSSRQFYNFNSSYCAHFNNITRSYKNYPVNKLLQSSQATDVIALTNEPGASIDLVVPGIKSLPAGIINKAELQLTLLPGLNSTYSGADTLFAPERLYPTGVANAMFPPNVGAGVAYNVADRYPVYSTSPLAVMDGFLHPFPAVGTTPLRQTFTIDLPREVMYSIAQKNDTLHFKITGTQDFYGAFHMVAGGGNYGVNGTSDTLYRAKLIVTYSKINQ
jgi:hypothetical protein